MHATAPTGSSSTTKRVINPYADAPEGSKKKYDVSSGFYHLIMGVWEIKPNCEAIELASLQPGEDVLDVAFGTGWCIEHIMDKVETDVYGIDFSRGMCEKCVMNLEKQGVQHMANLVEGDATRLPFQDASFDVVFSTFLLDLLPQADIPRVLSEMKRVLRPDGRIVAMTLTKEGGGVSKGMRWLYECFYDLWPTIGGYRPSSRPIFLAEAVKTAGFQIKREKMTHIPLFYFPVKIVVAHKD